MVSIVCEMAGVPQQGTAITAINADQLTQRAGEIIPTSLNVQYPIVTRATKYRGSGTTVKGVEGSVLPLVLISGSVPR